MSNGMGGCNCAQQAPTGAYFTQQDPMGAYFTQQPPALAATNGNGKPSMGVIMGGVLIAGAIVAVMYFSEK